MSLTMGRGPLAPTRPGDVNYDIHGPARLLFLDDFPRRVRARFAGETLLDTRRGRLLHESGLLPVLYVPDEDLASGLLHRTQRTTRCPVKGRATYWSAHAAGRTADAAVWAYLDPEPAASWLRGYKAVYWDAMDAWYDEDEEVHGHLRDPYHRVDVRATTQRVRVVAGEQVLAESTRAKVLSETGLPNRMYLPREDVRVELRRSETSTVCPYKGTASYWSTPGATDVAWSYDEPLDDAARVAGHLCFLHDDVAVELG